MKLKPDALIGSSLYLATLGGHEVPAPVPLRNGIPHHSDTLTRHAYETVASLTPYDNPRYYLADELEKLEFEEPYPEEAEILKGVAVYDAKKLLADIFPPRVLHELDISEDIGMADVHEEEDTPYTTPRLNDIILLASACDLTGDEKLLNALGYIVDHTAEELDEQLTKALMAAEETGNSLMQEYRRVRAENSRKNEELNGDDGARRFIELMRRAGNQKISYLDRQVARHKAKKEAPPNDEGGTGVLAS
jgi:hypothetical protein